MKMKFTLVLLLAWMLCVFSASADNEQLTADQIKQLAQNLKYKQGAITIQGGLATLEVPTNFCFLDANDAKTVLVKFWGNPPSQVDDTLGLLIPAGMSPLDDGCWVVTISYSNDGYVKDDDASKINYNDLLKQMQKDTE